MLAAGKPRSHFLDDRAATWVWIGPGNAGGLAIASDLPPPGRGRGVSARAGLRSMLEPRGRFKLGRRPALADRPMLWKERHTGGPRGFARFISFLIWLIGGGFLLYYTVSYVRMAFVEMWKYGYVPAGFITSYGCTASASTHLCITVFRGFTCWVASLYPVRRPRRSHPSTKKTHGLASQLPN